MTEKYGLIADIGGTNARFALADRGGVHNPLVFQCEDYEGVVEAAEAYLAQSGVSVRPETASFAVAGPVLGDWFEIVNNPWAFSVKDTGRALGFNHLELINDFVAIALAIPYLKPEDYTQIGGGEVKEHMPKGVLGPGTGLGAASLVWDGSKYIPVQGEGGHVTMPAKTQREFDLLNALLAKKYSHVSAERVCSGKGLVNLYDAIRIVDGRDDLPDRTPQEISEAALNKECVACEEVLDVMLGFLGTVAGNLALSVGALGGVYIAGGIPAKLGDYFFQSRFREEFTAKGRYKEYLEAIPTYLITRPFVAFLGLQNHLIERESI